jgi:hypothetical protein
MREVEHSTFLSQPAYCSTIGFIPTGTTWPEISIVVLAVVMS